MTEHQPVYYELFCLVFGEDTPFSVNIQPNMTVGDLKDAIKLEKQPELDHLAAYRLMLYLVTIPDDDDLATNVRQEFNSNPAPKPLRATSRLSTLFPDTPTEETVHIVVQIPKTETGKRKSDDDPLEDEPTTKRMRGLEDIPSLAPSSATMKTVSKTFGDKIDYNRPAPFHETIPIALLHEVFGTFLDDFREHQPTAADNVCLAELRTEMLKEHQGEHARAIMFRYILKNYGIVVEPGTIRTYSTDGDARVGSHIFFITQGKNEWSGLSSDPLLQAFLYYAMSIDDIPKKERDTPLPCLLIYYAGAFIGFAGAVAGARPQLEPLTPMFTYQTNAHDKAATQPIARALYAARRAYQSLKTMYNGTMPPHSPIFPYRNHYMDKGNKVAFTYHQRIHPKKLLFKCIRTDNQEPICVKFTQKYSRETHEHCAFKGIAPQLYAVDPISGEWLMIVMELLPDNVYKLLKKEDKSRVENALRLVVDTLHQKGLVHGDIRATNFMVRQEWDSANEVENVRLIDFDWAGPEETTVYPPFVNWWDIVRPDDAKDGLPIKKEHDIFMLEHIFKEL